MRTKRQRFRILRIEGLDDLRPQHACGAQLGNLHEMVHANAPKKRDARSKAVNVESRLHSSAQIFKAVGERVSQLDVGRGSSFLHVVSAYADAVELRHFLGAV